MQKVCATQQNFSKTMYIFLNSKLYSWRAFIVFSRKEGFAETIKILGMFENGAAPQKKFFKKFRNSTATTMHFLE